MKTKRGLLGVVLLLSGLVEACVAYALLFHPWGVVSAFPKLERMVSLNDLRLMAALPLGLLVASLYRYFKS